MELPHEFSSVQFTGTYNVRAMLAQHQLQGGWQTFLGEGTLAHDAPGPHRPRSLAVWPRAPRVRAAVAVVNSNTAGLRRANEIAPGRARSQRSG